MYRFLRALVLIGAAINAWVALGYLIFSAEVGSRPMTGWQVVATWLMLIVAPGLTFVPLARMLNAALYEVEGIAGWAAFGFVLTFVTPGATLSRTEFLVFLLPLTVVIATLATLIAYAFGFRVYRNDPRQRDFLRARRQGYLVALVIVALFLLHGIQVLSPVNGGLLIVIAVLCEIVILSRGRSAPARSTPARG